MHRFYSRGCQHRRAIPFAMPALPRSRRCSSTAVQKRAVALLAAILFAVAPVLNFVTLALHGDRCGNQNQHAGHKIARRAVAAPPDGNNDEKYFTATAGVPTVAECL